MLVHGKADVEYMPLPADLSARYQHFTQADLTGLRDTGCDLEFTHLEDGIQETFQSTDAIPV